MKSPVSVAIGCDEAACELKEIIKAHVLSLGYAMVDFGTHDRPRDRTGIG